MSLESWLFEVPVDDKTQVRSREIGLLVISLQPYTGGWAAYVDSQDYSVGRFGDTPQKALREIERKLLKDFPALKDTFNPQIPKTALERVLSDEELF